MRIHDGRSGAIGVAVTQTQCMAEFMERDPPFPLPPVRGMAVYLGIYVSRKELDRTLIAESASEYDVVSRCCSIVDCYIRVRHRTRRNGDNPHSGRSAIPIEGSCVQVIGIRRGAGPYQPK